MIEIKVHNGPARMGKYKELKTPNILRMDSSLPFIEDEPMPYDVPKPLAEFSVYRTIQKAEKSEQTGIAVIHGSKYLELRTQCALELEKLGNQVLMIANSEELLKRPRDLINMTVNIRDTINPNTALYFPFVKTSFIPLLTYLGVDFFGEVSCDFYAQLGLMMTPDTIYDLENYQIYEFSLEELKNYNQRIMDFVLREVRENIKNGTLRNLVEERCCSSPEAMSALRIVDRDYSDFLDKYTPLY
jgi:7-cyano-7-deazaguanine tRNA-ribosyltransferase